MAYKLYRDGYRTSYDQIFLRRCFEVFPLEAQLHGNPILEIGEASDFHAVHSATEYPVVNLIDDPRASISGEGLSWVNVYGDIIGNQLNVRRVGSNIPKRFNYDMSNIIELEKTNPIFHLAASYCRNDMVIDVDFIKKSKLEELKRKYPLLSVDVLEKVIIMANECSITEIDRAFDMVILNLKKINTPIGLELRNNSSLPIISGEVVPIDKNITSENFFQRSEELIDTLPHEVLSYREDQLKDHLGNPLLFKCLYIAKKRR